MTYTPRYCYIVPIRMKDTSQHYIIFHFISTIVMIKYTIVEMRLLMVFNNNVNERKEAVLILFNTIEESNMMILRDS